MVDELKILLPALQDAGDAILARQKAGYSITNKKNCDIVTQADLEANAILQAAITKHFPDDGWLSEETADDKSRLKCARVWIVDPIDGTKEFTNGIPEYAISVALVSAGQPIVAAVYNPATNELFHAVKGEGAWLGDSQLHCQRQKHHGQLLLLASRSEYQRGEWAQFKRQHHVQVVGSIAYKLALIAAGKADATFSLGPKSEWDIAAGVMLVQEAGGVVLNQFRARIQFNQENILVPGIVACSPNSTAEVFALFPIVP